MTQLPANIEKVHVPPIKCQGIKTKLVPFIAASIQWDSGHDGTWIEPFLGSGVVAFNLAPDRALLADSNVHIIRLYQDIQTGAITPSIVRHHLESEAPHLAQRGADYYYEVRDRFNQHAGSLDFLFLNRSCFNGLMRFNRRGSFNVPFGHKPNRFSRAYITKIVNQVAWVANLMRNKDWTFTVSEWRETMAKAGSQDFIYLDPPYYGRHTDYFNSWDESDAIALAEVSKRTSAGVALSMWQENRYRRNDHLDTHWQPFRKRLFSHFYHVGARESLRNEMQEALAITPGFDTDPSLVPASPKPSAWASTFRPEQP